MKPGQCKSTYILLFLTMISLPLFAADPDVVTFVNGETMTGQLIKVADGKVTFKSDMVGEVTFEWAKVKDLKTTKPFAVVAKGAKLGNHAEQAPEGNLTVSDSKVVVNTAAPVTIPADQAAFVVDQATYEKEMKRGGIFTGWMGAITAGVSLVEATQNNTNIATSFTFVRKSPVAPWMPAKTRTLIDFSNNYGKVTQPGTPDVKTSI